MVLCSTVEAGVEGSWMGSSGGASDPIVEGGDAGGGVVVAGGGSGGSGSVSRGYFLPWAASSPLLLRPEGGGRLVSA